MQNLFMNKQAEHIWQVHEHLQPNCEHVITWSHYPAADRIAAADEAVTGTVVTASASASKQPESIRFLAWHRNFGDALERLAKSVMDLELIPDHSVSAEKSALGEVEFEPYVRNSQGSPQTTARGIGRGNRSEHPCEIDVQPSCESGNSLGANRCTGDCEDVTCCHKYGQKC